MPGLGYAYDYISGFTVVRNCSSYISRRQWLLDRLQVEMDLSSFIIECGRRLGYESLKDKQVEAIPTFMKGNDILALFHSLLVWPASP